MAQDKAPDQQAQLAAARAELEGLTGKARQKLARQAQAARDRIAHAVERGAFWQGLIDQLAPIVQTGHAEAAYQAASAKLMVDMYAAIKRMMEIELAAHESNGKLVAETPTGPIAFRDATQEQAFHEQRLRIDAALGPFLWRARIDGIDAVMRATGLGPARADAGDEAQREARAEAIRQEAAGDLALERSLSGLADDLAGMDRALAWAQTAFNGYARLGVDQQRALLKDARWAQVAAAIADLQKLHTRVGGYPSVSKLFPRPVEVELPYAPINTSPDGPARAAAAPAVGGDQVALNRGRSSTMRLGDGPKFPPPKR